MRSIRNLALLAAMVAVAAGMAVFGSTTRVAHADEPALEPGILEVHKHCDPEDALGTFNITLDFTFEFTGDPEPTTPPEDPQNGWDVNFTLSCGDTYIIAAEDGQGDASLAELIAWYGENLAAGAIESASASVTEEELPGIQTEYSDDDEGDCTWDEEDIADFLASGKWCVIDNIIADPNIIISKTFDGEPADFDFEFAFTTDATEGCLLDIAGDPLTVIETGGTFNLMGGETANITCPPGSTFSVTELVPDGVTVEISCSTDLGATANVDNAEGSVDGNLGSAQGIVNCTFANTGDVTVETGIINVNKFCTTEFDDASFSVDIGTDPLPIECGETVAFGDLEPGTYTLTETIEGDEEIVTVIVCTNGAFAEGTSIEVELAAGESVLCIVINGGEELEDIVCPCPGNEIDIDNNNTNVIDLDNDNTNTNANNNENENENENENTNENNNVNTNTQNQENKQDQKNENTQTNNIDASPKINIDLD